MPTPGALRQAQGHMFTLTPTVTLCHRGCHRDCARLSATDSGVATVTVNFKITVTCLKFAVVLRLSQARGSIYPVIVHSTQPESR